MQSPWAWGSCLPSWSPLHFQYLAECLTHSVASADACLKHACMNPRWAYADSSRAGPFKFHTTDISGRIVLCCGICCSHSRMVSYISGLYSLDDAGIPTPSCDNPNCFQTLMTDWKTRHIDRHNATSYSRETEKRPFPNGWTLLITPAYYESALSQVRFFGNKYSKGSLHNITTPIIGKYLK